MSIKTIEETPSVLRMHQCGIVYKNESTVLCCKTFKVIGKYRSAPFGIVLSYLE